MNESITPFRIAVPDEVLDDLRARLDRTRLPGSDVPGAGWDLGTDPALLDRLLTHWRDGFDWRAAEAALNRLPQFTAPIQGTRCISCTCAGAGSMGVRRRCRCCSATAGRDRSGRSTRSSGR